MHQVWATDFMSGQLADGRRVIRALEERREVRDLPERIMTDNGPEFTSRAMDRWAHARDVKLQFIEPGRPVQNGYMESFNEKFRDVKDARQLTEKYRTDYNQQRPHSALGNLTPEEFIRRVAGAAPHGGREGGESATGLPKVNLETMPAGLSPDVFQ